MKQKTTIPKAQLPKECQPFLKAMSFVQDIISQRDEAIEKMQRWSKWEQRPNSRKKSKLPSPRMEFEYVPSTDGWGTHWCIYWLVLPLSEWDVRSENDEGKMGVFRGRYIPMGETKISGGRDEPPVYNGEVRTPFRDGAHATMDCEALGLPNLPVYARCEELTTLIEYKPKT